MTQPTEVERTKPTLAELLTTFVQAVADIEKHNLPYTAHHVTLQARKSSPNLEISHEAIRGLILAAMPHVNDYAVIFGAEVGGNEARLFQRTLPHP